MPVFRGITRVSVNNGLSTLFWKDNWNNAVYAEKFPQAFSFASTEDVSVQTFLGTSSLQEAFSLPLSEQAYDELRMIQQEIREVQLNPRGDDWGNDVGTQYRSGIYYYTAEQERQARESLAEKQREWKEKIVTEVLPARRFYPAEDYHQQYLEKGGQSAKKRCSDPIRCYG
ncbi:methionine sulfoxide reductase MSRA2 [Hordeum vulgare]|nr:methionine sulfoxide reductase MSRA2 [Hordeum vulgare]